MNTAKLRRFAIEARTKIKQGVVMMMRQWGFDADGNVLEEPIKIDGGTIFRGKVIGGEDVYTRWDALRNRIATAGLKQVYEEASYTWFNRFVAIKILSKNGLLEGFLDNVESKPLILSQARRNAFPLTLTEDERRKALELAGDHEREFDLFTFLITSVCHSTPILANCFGKINDYTELLLPRSILTQGDFIEMLNDDEYISDDDYRQAELIGWLYQFYIAERKDEVFASFKSGKKAAKEDIPAATQIFTPNWIVKYMVQNTIGRIYLDNFPDSELASKWKYLVEPAEGSHSEENILKIENPEELTLADKGCGSGHILVEGFDVLFDIYKEQYASDTEACESILKYNLVGVDIDTRAKQLAQFALLMKACKHVPEMADCHIMPQVYDMPEPLSAQEMDSLHDSLPHFFLGGNEKVISETIDALTLLQQAQDLGSVMKFNVSESTRYAIETALKDADSIFSFIPHLRLMLALTKKYASLCMNPPYLESGNMNSQVSSYVNNEYKDGKNDMYTVFMILARESIICNGKYGMINMDTWTYKSSFLNIRKYVLDGSTIDSMILLGARTFGELSGEVVQNVCFCISNNKCNIKGAFYNVSSAASCNKKCEDFLNSQANNLHYLNQNDFLKLPGQSITIIDDVYLKIFSTLKTLSTVGESKQGLATGNNDTFVRNWHEVSFHKMGLGINSTLTSIESEKKWFPYNKGGNRRKWYGNQELLVNWENDGELIKDFRDDKGKLRSRPQNTQCYFKPSISWGLISGPFFRYFPNGFIYDIQGMSFFVNNNEDTFNTLAWMNSKVFLIIRLCTCYIRNY